MQLKNAAAPFFRRTDSEGSIALEKLAAPVLLLVGAVSVYGFRALVMALSGVLGAVGTLFIWSKLRKADFGELAPSVYLGLCCSLLLPCASPVWLPMCAAAFSVFTTKLVFGSSGRNPLCAAALGYCFAALCRADLKSHYNAALLAESERIVYSGSFELCFSSLKAKLPLFADIIPDESSFLSMLSPSAMLRAGVDPKLSASELLLFGRNAAMGSVGIILLLVCAIWLFARRLAVWRTSAAFLGLSFVLAFIFPYVGVSRPLSTVYELFTGSVLFAALFLCADSSVSPHTHTGQLVFGGGCAALSVLLRRIGIIEGGEIFALLLMCTVAQPIDLLVWKLRSGGMSLHDEKDKLLHDLRIKLRLKNSLGESYAELEELERSRRKEDSGNEQ